MSIYLLNADDMKLEGKFESTLDADRAGQKSKFSYLVVKEAKELESFPAKELCKLRPNVGLSVMKPGSLGAKDKACLAIWEAAEKLKFEIVKEGTATEKKKPGKPRMGKYIKKRLLEDDFKGMDEAAIIKEVRSANISEKDAEKDVMDCVKWYRRALRKDIAKADPKASSLMD